jgi:twitching motility two-component system response regulator PilH
MKTVLVVDDMQAETTLLSNCLKKAGYLVRTAADGKQALEDVSRQKPDAIISDWMMPEMGGLELCRNLRKNPTTADIPVIAYTVKDRDIDRKWAAKQGVSVYLIKPCTEDQIIDAIKSVLG